MMLYPPVAELTEKVGSRYQLVNLVAKRARKLSEIAEETGIPMEKKPVSAAIDEVYTGKLSIVSSKASSFYEDAASEEESSAEE